MASAETATAKPLSQTILGDSSHDMRLIQPRSKLHVHVVNGLEAIQETSPGSSHVSLLDEEKHTVHRTKWVTGVIFPLAPQYGEGVNYGSSLAAVSSQIFILSIVEIFPSVNLASEENFPLSDTSCFMVEPEMPSTISNALSDECEVTELVTNHGLQHQLEHQLHDSTPALTMDYDHILYDQLPYFIEPFSMPLDRSLEHA